MKINTQYRGIAIDKHAIAQYLCSNNTDKLNYNMENTKTSKNLKDKKEPVSANKIKDIRIRGTEERTKRIDEGFKKTGLNTTTALFDYALNLVLNNN